MIIMFTHFSWSHTSCTQRRRHGRSRVGLHQR